MNIRCLFIGIFLTLLLACDDAPVPALPLTKQVRLHKFGISLRLPSDWKVQEEPALNHEACSYLISGNHAVMRIQQRQRPCFATSADVTNYAQIMLEQHRNIDPKKILTDSNRSATKHTPIEYLIYPNGTYGLQYSRTFTASIHGQEAFIERTGLYTFDFMTQDSVCLAIENTTYNNQGETLATDLKIIQSIQ